VSACRSAAANSQNAALTPHHTHEMLRSSNGERSMIAKYLTAYIATGIAFALIDSVWLRNAYARLYQPEIGEMLYAGGVRWTPAISFYLLYILGMMVFAVVPGLKAGNWQVALVQGAMLGFFCYMTYDLTNYATLKVWSLKVTILDIIWGTVLTGSASAAGCWIATLIFGQGKAI
jgi:uncharacterized membrane protein